jgi:hypothetical protein
MSDAMQQSLSRAYDLIESNQHTQAQSLLEPLLDEYVDDADLWWLYAHSVKDTSTAQDALQNVLRIDPQYPGATQLDQQLKRSLGVTKSSESDDMINFEDDFGDDEEDDSSRRKLIGRLALVAIAIILIVIAVAILTSSGGDDKPESTPTESVQVAIDPTTIPTSADMPTATVEIDPTVTTAVASSAGLSQNELDTLNAALAQFELADAGGEIVNTDLGSTVLFSICTLSGDELRATLDEAMIALASESSVILSEVDSLGVELVDCTQDATLNFVAVDLDDAKAFANATITDQEFRSKWRAVGIIE